MIARISRNLNGIDIEAEKLTGSAAKKSPTSCPVRLLGKGSPNHFESPSGRSEGPKADGAFGIGQNRHENLTLF